MTPQPFHIIQCPLEGTNLIEASAGTGKTYTICSLYARLIIEKAYHVSNILVVTYTDAATEELRGRIRNVLYDMHVLYASYLRNKKISSSSYDSWMIDLFGKCPPTAKHVQNLEMAIRNFDEAAIYTIHGFCHRVLQENAFESGVIFDAELLTDVSHLIQEISDDFFRTHLYEASLLFLQYARKTGHTPDMIRKWIGYVLQMPFVEIMPDVICPSEQEIAYQEKHYTSFFEQTHIVFNSYYNDIKELLTYDNSLNKTIYPKKSIPGFMRTLASFFSELPYTQLPIELLKKFQACEIRKNTKKSFVPPQHQFFDICEQLMDSYADLEALYEKKMTYIKREFMQKAQPVLTEKKKKLQIQSFDDLLHYVYKALKDGEDSLLATSIRKKYRTALIDEFQDTDPIQYQIFYTIFNYPNCILYIIGDPKQAIYSFRGADLFAYLKGAENSDHQYTLDKNWRSSSLLVEAINAMFLQNPAAFVYKNMKFQAVQSQLPQVQMIIENIPQAPLQILYIEDPETPETPLNKKTAREIIYDQVTDHINTLLQLSRNNLASLDNNPIQSSDIAVLVRNNFEAHHIQVALRKRGIPGVVFSKDRVWLSAICNDLSQTIAAVVDFQNEQKLKSALTSALIGLNADDLLDIIADSNRYDEWVTRFQSYHELWQQKGFMVMFRFLLSTENVRANILSMENGERLLTDLLHIAELLHQVDSEKQPGMSGLIEYFNRFITGEQFARHESNMRLETDENAVKIVTIHKSKGLQYKIVYCPFLWDGAKLHKDSPFVIHDPENEFVLTLPITEEERNNCIEWAHSEYLAENMRLLYVALTRAQYQCYLVHGNISTAASSPLSWLLHGKDFIQDGKVPSDIVSVLNNSRMTRKKTWLALNQLAKITSIQVCYQKWPLPEISSSHGVSFAETTPVSYDLACLKPHQKIDASWCITSFSALTSITHHASEVPDYDHHIDLHHDIAQHAEKAPKPMSIFAFPKGSRPGTFLHELLEHVDFEKSDVSSIERLVSDRLAEYGFDLQWKKTIIRLIDRVKWACLSKTDPDFRLCHIQSVDQIIELGFYFPIKDLQPNRIKSIIDTVPWVRRSKVDMYPLDTYQINGMMKGFIDLIFSYKNKFYIIDWKSNYLGPELKNYNQSAMKRSILEHYYILQYYIYTIALHRYLGQRIENYDYETHFGGIYYIFLRGLDNKHSGNYGIFWDRPSKDTVMALDQFFHEGLHFFFKQSAFFSQKSFDF
jgi:exodeoxyribonuclease V beta subunit